MTLVVAISLLLTLQTTQLPGAPAASQEPKGAVEGSVVRLSSGEPLAQAEVTLSKVLPPVPPPAPGKNAAEPDEPAPIPAVHTEEDGKFSIKGLEAGQYRMRVVRNGYETQQYGQRSTFGQGSIITVAADQTVKNLTVRMQQASTVSGHIFDSTGQPVTGVSVALLKSAYNYNGSRNFQEAGVSITDDRGEYRIFWVSPGRYLLSVSPAAGIASFVFRRENMITERSYPTTYYPGTTDVTRASLIDLQAGAELSTIDVVLTKPSTFRIKGTVVDTKTGQPPKSVDISLVPRAQPGGASSKFGFEGTNVHYANGVFEIPNVIPGSYWIRASQTPDWNGPLPAGAAASARTTEDLFAIAFQSLASAQVSADVFAANLDSVKLTLTPGLSIPVRVRMDGQELSSISQIDRLRFGLWSSDPSTFNNPDGARQPGPISAEGAATLDSVTPGEYRVWIAGPHAELYIKEASIEGVDALNGWWTIKESVTGTLNIVMGNKPGQIEGALVDALSKPVSGAGVVLIPDQNRYRDELYKTADTDENGHFTIRGIPPGSYRLFSWEDLEPFAYFDREILSRFEQQGKPVQIGESSKQNVEVRIIPAGH